MSSVEQIIAQSGIATTITASSHLTKQLRRIVAAFLPALVEVGCVSIQQTGTRCALLAFGESISIRKGANGLGRQVQEAGDLTDIPAFLVECSNVLVAFQAVMAPTVFELFEHALCAAR